MNFMKKQEYCIGLDIGTNSTGYAMTDMDGHLLKHHKRSTFGAVLFDEASPAQDRRMARSTRRRLDRREQRIDLLQWLLSDEVAKKDPEFFLRLNESFLQDDERKYPLVYGTLPVSIWTDGSPFVMPDGTPLLDQNGKIRVYPTIYHLRYALMHTPKQADIRYVYLALHHIIKYRGHFLMEGQTLSADNQDIKKDILELLTQVKEILDQPDDDDEPSRNSFRLDDVTVDHVYSVLQNKSLSNSARADEFIKALSPVKEAKAAIKQLAALLVGNSGSLKTLLGYEGDTPAEKVSLAKDDLDTDSYIDALGENGGTFELLLRIYQWQLFCGLREPGETISFTMIKRYEQHRRDLKQLKDWVKIYAQTQYDDFFRAADKENYCTYSGHYKMRRLPKDTKVKQCDQEKFYKALDALFATASAEGQAAAASMKKAKEYNNGFLPLLRINFNGAIPNQLHAEELSMLIDNQGRFYPSLLENKDKIMALCTFRLPYYVGPLNDRSPFAKWIKRDHDAHAYPWNFFDVVHKMETAEGFINNLTNKCTYLPTEDVLPLHSLLYEEYLLLDELNRVTIKGKLIAPELKERIITGLFMRRKNVSRKAFAKWLRENSCYTNVAEEEIEHLHGADGFAASLRTCNDLLSHGFEINADTRPMLDKLILWSTIFENRSILREKISTSYPELNEAQIAYICRRRYTGWGRLSEKLLDGLMGTLEHEPATVIEIMRKTNDNFMKVINDKRYGIVSAIDAYWQGSKEGPIRYEEVRELQGSPALKRGVWQAVRIVQELVENQGHAPKAIYIENTRSEDEMRKGKRTIDRIAQLESLYRMVDAEDDDCGCRQTLLECKTKKERLTDRQFLYFLQMGKCLYTNTPLDFRHLELYQIDHILPQSYIKDDSLENRALVISAENQRKRDSQLLQQDVQQHMRGQWRFLYQRGLMGNKKFRNLTRTAVSEYEQLGFINRQLVETSQIIKHVVTLFKAHYPNTRVEGINARLSAAVRDKYELYKIRELNDTHHAFDAFLACTMGTFMDRYFSWISDESVAAAKARAAWLKAKGSEHRINTDGIILGSFNHDQVDEETGEILRDAGKHIAYVKAVWGYRDHFIVRRKTESTGKFYDETRYPAGSVKAKIPLRGNLPVSRYGGFNSVKPAYIAAVTCKKGKKALNTLVNVPIMLLSAYEKDPNALADYLLTYDDDFAGCTDFQIIKKKILLNQKIEYEGSELLLKSCSEAWNGKQLYLGATEKALLYRLTHFSETKWECTEQDLTALYQTLMTKLREQYPIYYDTVGSRLVKAQEKTDALSLKEKALLILETLKIMQVSGNFAMYKTKLPSIGLSDNQGRITNKPFVLSKITLIDQSITGFYERRTPLWASEQS